MKYFLVLLILNLNFCLEAKKSAFDFNSGGIGSFFLVLFATQSAPSNSFSYPSSAYTFTQNTAITSITISSIVFTSCTSTPSLPTGLTLSATCWISGTPTVSQAETNYKITGTSSRGNFTANITITVNPPGCSNLASATVNVTTLAGSGVATFNDGTGTAATFNNPYNIAIDSSGVLYITDYVNHRIRKVTTSGVVTTFAGSGAGASTDGTGTGASFNFPYGIAIDSSSNIYVSDSATHCIRKITSAAVVVTFAGTAGSTGFTDATGMLARFNSPYGIGVDSSGNIYVVEGNNKIRKITPGAVVTTFAGTATTISGYLDGTGTAALFTSPKGSVVDSSGNIFVTDETNNRIRKVTQGGVVTTFAGSGVASSTDGTGTGASFNSPIGITIDINGNLYIADTVNHKIRKITPAGVVTTIAGTGASGFNDSTGTLALFNSPKGIAIDSNGIIYVADTSNHKIRKITCN